MNLITISPAIVIKFKGIVIRFDLPEPAAERVFFSVTVKKRFGIRSGKNGIIFIRKEKKCYGRKRITGKDLRPAER